MLLVGVLLTGVGNQKDSRPAGSKPPDFCQSASLSQFPDTSGDFDRWAKTRPSRRRLVERELFFMADQDDLRRRAIAWVERSCAEQGVPAKLSDPELLDRVAKILEEGRRNRQKRRQA